MKSICQHCGASKTDPLTPCKICRTGPPQGEHQVCLALLLSEVFMTTDQLAGASNQIRSGTPVQITPQERAQILQILRSQPSPAGRSGSRSGAGSAAGIFTFIKWALILGVIAFVLCSIFPYPRYKWAQFRDTVESYESFLNWFRDGPYVDAARNRISYLQDDPTWKTTSPRGESGFRHYLTLYPNGRHSAEAMAGMQKIATDKWTGRVAPSRDEDFIKKFIADYRQFVDMAAAEALLKNLHDDLAWVKEQNNFAAVERFIASHPGHPEIDSLNKLVIDLKVKAIASGNYGEMPPAEILRLGGSMSEVEVENQTQYELTVLYSGASSTQLVIPPGQKKSASLRPGRYQVAASVSASNVTSFYGQETMQGGSYGSSFYISTTYGGRSYGGLPSSRSRR